MQILSIIFLAFVISASFISEGWAQPASDLSQADNQFAFDLYSHLASHQGNIFFSPYSLSSALEMAYEGARGETAQEMRSLLHLNADDTARRSRIASFIQEINLPGKAYELTVANAFWAGQAYPFKEDYLNLVKHVYFAQVRNLDFISNPEPSRETINNWVSEKTKNHINGLLPSGSITKETRLVLTDAVYFKGKWQTPFKKQFTRPDAFWLTPDQSVLTDMMAIKGESFDYMDNEQAQVLKLPYQGADLDMCIILPRSKDLQDLQKTLTPDLLTQWQQDMKLEGVNVFIPKFKFDAEYMMKDILSGMGMKLAFDPQNADFSGMAELQPGWHLCIDEVYHKAWVDVNEEGTEAAAATGVGMLSSLARMEPLNPKIFRADHPFLFVIQDKNSGHILFMGRVSDPRGK